MPILLWFAACGLSTPPVSSAPDVEPAPAVGAPVTDPEPAGPPPVDLVVPAGVDAMASRLTELEREIRDPATPLERLPDLGHAHQRILRHLGTDPVAAGAVIAKLEEPAKKSVARLLEATTSMAHTVPEPKTELPPWKIVEPLPAEELLRYYRESQSAHGVPWTVLAAINLNETRMGQLRGLSSVGAQGPMQFMPKTWASYGKGDPNDDRDAILAAGNYLSAMGWAKDSSRAIWNYNHSPAYVKGIELCADAMAEEPRMFYAFRGWKVYYRTVAGSIWLRTGYEQSEPIPIEQYCSEVGEPYCPKQH